MPSVNTTSLREEIQHLRTEYDRLRGAGTVPEEMRIFIQSMFVLFDLIVAVFLEKTTKKSNTNSSKPSSQTDKDESATSRAGTNGRGRKEQAGIFSNRRTVETTTTAKVDLCDCCGESLLNTPCAKHERRTKIDIVFEKVVEHVDAEIKTCPYCKSVVKGQFPVDMPGPLQYGDGIKAFIVNLVVSQMVSLSRTAKMLKTLIDVSISEHTILRYVLELYNKLADWEQSATEALLTSLTMHNDETSLRVNKRNYWVHTYSSGEITLKFLHAKRGKEAIEDIGILPRYGGVVIHDCWSPYFCYDNYQNALCGSHLLRELTFVIESNHYAWARHMKRLLRETCRKVSMREAKCLTPAEYANLQKRYRQILTRGEKEMPSTPERQDGKRGKIAKSDAHNLWERLKKHETAVLLFAKLPHVPFTNNRAERDLRMDKVKQKVSGCFRSPTFAKAYCRISSYLLTMANRGINPLIAIQMALKGNAPLEGRE